VAGDSMTLTLGTPPHEVSAMAPGWVVDGVDDEGHVEGSIQLSRSAEPGQAPAEAETGPQSLPPWLHIWRDFVLGVKWTVVTQVKRVSPKGTPIVARFPLLPGEKVVTADLLVEGSDVVMSLGRDADTLRWESAIEPRDKLELRAPEGKPWTELWFVRCGPIWRCTAKGLDPFQRMSVDQTWLPAYRPWPGETLSWSIVRPGPAQGQSATIDEATLTFVPGLRLLNAELTLGIRTSTGGTQRLRLSPEAKIQKLSVKGSEQPVRFENGELGLALTPGTQQVVVKWQQPGGIGLKIRTPRVELGAEAVNARVVVRAPADRWLLAFGGPSWGPSTTFWATFVLLLAVGAILGRLRLSPLRSSQWCLLAIGFVTLPAAVAIIVACWFFLLAYRKGWSIHKPVWRNLAQVGLLAATAAFAVCLVGAVVTVLTKLPMMVSAGFERPWLNFVSDAKGSGIELQWYAERVANAMPEPWILSAPQWLWRVLMLAWAVWLAWSLLSWMRWAWANFTDGGAWRPMAVGRSRPRAAAPTAAAQATSAVATEPAAAPATTPEASEPAAAGTTAPSAPPTAPADKASSSGSKS